MPRLPNPNTFLKRLCEDARASEKIRCDALNDLGAEAPAALLLRLLRGKDTPPAIRAKAIEIYDLRLARKGEPDVTTSSSSPDNR